MSIWLKKKQKTEKNPDLASLTHQLTSFEQKCHDLEISGHKQREQLMAEEAQGQLLQEKLLQLQINHGILENQLHQHNQDYASKQLENGQQQLLLQNLLGENQQLEQQLSSLKMQSEQIERDRHLLLDEIRLEKSRYSQFHNQLVALKNAVVSREQTYQRARQILTSAQEQDRNQDKEYQNLVIKKDQLAFTTIQAENEIKELVKKAQEKVKEQAKIQELMAKVQFEYQVKSQKLAERKKYYQGVFTRYQQAHGQLEQVKAQLRSTTNEISVYEQKIVEMKTQMDRQQSIGALKAQALERENQRKTYLEAQAKQQQQEVLEFQRSNQELSSQVRTLRQDNRLLIGRLEIVQKQSAIMDKKANYYQDRLEILSHQARELVTKMETEGQKFFQVEERYSMAADELKTIANKLQQVRQQHTYYLDNQKILQEKQQQYTSAISMRQAELVRLQEEYFRIEKQDQIETEANHQLSQQLMGLDQQVENLLTQLEKSTVVAGEKLHHQQQLKNQIKAKKQQLAKLDWLAQKRLNLRTPFLEQ